MTKVSKREIVFFNKSDGRIAELSSYYAKGFLINKNGAVVEYVEQSYANYTCLLEREDVDWRHSNTSKLG